MAKYINTDTEVFIKGTYRGESVFEVAEEDAEYLNNLLANFPVDSEDRDIITLALGKSIEE